MVLLGSNNPKEITRETDIMITNVGVPNLVHVNWIKPGAIVIDVENCPVEVNMSLFNFNIAKSFICFVG